MDIIKIIWKDVFYTECRKIIESYSKNKNVNEDQVKKFYDEYFKKHENAWEINYQGSDLKFFFEAFEDQTIDTSEKVNQLVNFIKNDLKLQNITGDRLPIRHIIDLIKFGQNSTVISDDVFNILMVNGQYDLPSEKLGECINEFCIEEIRLKCDDIEKLLSFGKNYKLPNPKSDAKAYARIVHAFFILLHDIMIYHVFGDKVLPGNLVENLEIVQKIFAYINKNMLQFKFLFGKIDNKNEGTYRKAFFECLSKNCIKIYLPEEKSNDGDIKVEIDYFKWFNQFVSDKLCDDNLDGYKEYYDKFVSEFSNEIGKHNIEITEDIKKQLMFDDELLNKTISQKNQTKLTDKNKNRIDEPEKFNLNIKTSHVTNPKKKEEKIDGISDNIQRQRPETSFTSTTKVSYLKLISKIVLYVLAVVACAVFIFSIIKAFWFLAILSFILCLGFVFIAYKIECKTIDEKLNQISTRNLNFRDEFVDIHKNDELNLNQMPETIKKDVIAKKDKDNE